jgi:Flp pilus assembly pilin Flp
LCIPKYWARMIMRVTTMRGFLFRLWQAKQGQDMIEYALIAAALVVIVAGFLPTTLMPSVSVIFSKVVATFAKT